MERSPDFPPDVTPSTVVTVFGFMAPVFYRYQDLLRPVNITDGKKKR
jgi:hypothetical protein